MTLKEAIDAAWIASWNGDAPGQCDAFMSSLEENGFVIVPKEATKEMLMRGETAVDDNIDQLQGTDEPGATVYNPMVLAGEAYKAMLGARPKIDDE